MAEDKDKCQECGCHCDSCINNNSLHLHQEIENLKRQLKDRDYHIDQMENNVMNHAQQFPNGEWEAMRDELRFWQEKYNRLYESHKKLQKVNQGLEDKLLKIVDKFETEKSTLLREITNLGTKLAETRVSITELEEENEKYRHDCSIAVQLLQCKPTSFVAHKFSSLPCDLQENVKVHLSKSQKDRRSNSVLEPRTIRVPIPTFPPTAMVYSVSKVADPSIQSNQCKNNSHSPPDYVSAAVIAKVLEERSKERALKKQTKSCVCNSQRTLMEKATQTSRPMNIACPCEEKQIACVHNLHTGDHHNMHNSHSVCRGSTSSTETII